MKTPIIYITETSKQFVSIITYAFLISFKDNFGEELVEIFSLSGNCNVNTVKFTYHIGSYDNKIEIVPKDNPDLIRQILSYLKLQAYL